MAKIYNPPEHFKAPDIRTNPESYLKACDDYIKSIQKEIKSSYGWTCPEAGKLISFPVANGKALYVVVSLKPTVLVHVDTGNAFQYAHRLTAKDIKIEIKRAETNPF